MYSAAARKPSGVSPRLAANRPVDCRTWPLPPLQLNAVLKWRFLQGTSLHPCEYVRYLAQSTKNSHSFKRCKVKTEGLVCLLCVDCRVHQRCEVSLAGAVAVRLLHSHLGCLQPHAPIEQIIIVVPLLFHSAAEQVTMHKSGQGK